MRFTILQDPPLPMKEKVLPLKNAEQYTLVLCARRITFFLVNRVENKNEPKRPRSGGRLVSFWFSTRPLADTGIDTEITIIHQQRYVIYQPYNWTPIQLHHWTLIQLHKWTSIQLLCI